MTDGPVFNQQNSGTGNQNVQGMEVNMGDLNAAPRQDEFLTAERFLQILGAPKAMPDEVVEEVMPHLEKFVQLPNAEQEEVMKTDAWTGLVAKIKPHAGTIGKTLAVFGSAALKAFAAQNPICAGVIAVCDGLAESGGASDFGFSEE